LWGSNNNKTIVGIDGGKEKYLHNGDEDDDNDDVNDNRAEEETLDECNSQDSIHISHDIGAFIENRCIHSTLQAEEKIGISAPTLISMYQCFQKPNSTFN